MSDTMTVGAPVPEGRIGAGKWAEVELLQHHWDSLDDDRKTLFAQMAVLTRCLQSASFSEGCAILSICKTYVHASGTMES